jgi:hypothetical protein
LRNTIRALTIIALAFVFCGCGGSKSLVEAAVDLTGSWTVTETITEANSVCAQNVGSSYTYTLIAQQDGNDLTVTIGNDAQENVGMSFYGTVSGYDVEWSGSYPSSGGTTTIKGMDVTATDTSFSGIVNWSWAGGGDSCTGKTQVQGYKI